MTWTRTLATGSGKLAWRVSIDGYPVDAVSHRDMELPDTPDRVRTMGQAIVQSGRDNLLTLPTTWTGTSATVTTGVADPDGGTDAVTITDANGAALGSAITSSATYTTADAVWVSLLVRKDTSATNFAVIGIALDGTEVYGIALDLGTGQVAESPTPTAPTRYRAVELDGWWLVSFKYPGDVASTAEVVVYPAFGTSFPTLSAAATGSVTVYAPRLHRPAATSIARKRYVGLRSDGFRISEHVDLAYAKWEAEGITITLADIDQRWTDTFNRTPTALTYLSSDYTSGTTMTVQSNAGFTAPGVLYVDLDTITYTGTSGTTQFTGCARGQYNALSQSHYAESGRRARNPEVTNWPTSLEGRRVRIYVYGAGDDKAGDGTLFWVGVARTEPSFNGVEWSFSVDPLSSILDVDLGADLDDPVTLRGIYYPANAPLIMLIDENVSASADDGVAAETILALAGFWETQEEFVADLSTAIAYAIAHPTFGSFTQTSLRAEVMGESWGVAYETTNPSGRYLRCAIVSATDGEMNQGWVDVATGAIGIYDVSDGKSYRAGLYPEPTALSASLVPGTVPRATLGGFGPAFSFLGSVPDGNKTNVDEATNPDGRLYLSRDILSSVTQASVTWPAIVAGGDAYTFVAPVTAIDATNGSIDLNTDYLGLRSGAHVGAVAQYLAAAGSADAETIEIKLGLTVATGTLKDFLSGLAGLTSTYSAIGGCPYIRPTSGGIDGDFELGASAGQGGTEIDAAAAYTPLTASRTYTLQAKTSLSELIENECRLIGVYPCYASTGQITFRRLRLPSPAEVSSGTINATKIIVSNQFLTYEKSPFGLINQVRYALGYDPAQDDSLATPIIVRDLASVGRNPLARSLEIAPKSIDPAPAQLEDVVRLASRVLGVFGAPYSVLTVEVPLTLFSLALGDVVSVTWSKVPSGTDNGATSGDRGNLGVTAKIGLVIGREFEPMESNGKLVLLLTDQRIAGYAPAAKTTSLSGVSGGTGPFTVSLSSDYFPSGTTAADFFQANDKIRTFIWNSTSVANNATGTVTSVTLNAMQFTTDAAWTYGASTWCVGAAISTSITRSNQKLFAYEAGSDGMLDWSDTTNLPPFTLAP